MFKIVQNNNTTKNQQMRLLMKLPENVSKNASIKKRSRATLFSFLIA